MSSITLKDVQAFESSAIPYSTSASEGEERYLPKPDSTRGGHSNGHRRKRSISAPIVANQRQQRLFASPPPERAEQPGNVSNAVVQGQEKTVSTKFCQPDDPTNIVYSQNETPRLSQSPTTGEQQVQMVASEIIQAATLKKLIEKLTSDYLDSNRSSQEIFLLSYPSFITRDELLSLLIGRYECTDDSSIHLRVAKFLEMWIKKDFFDDFSSNNKQFVDTMHAFLRDTLNSRYSVKTSFLIKELLKKPSSYLVGSISESGESWVVADRWLCYLVTLQVQANAKRDASRASTIVSPPRNPTSQDSGAMSTNNSPPSPRTTRTDSPPTPTTSPSTTCENLVELAVSADPLRKRFEPKTLARQITFLLSQFWGRLRLKELLDTKSWAMSTQCPNVSAMTLLFNRLSLWVSSEILREVDLKRRVRIIEKFISTANELRQLNNFHGLQAILAGFNNQAVYRLTETWAAVSTKKMQVRDEMISLMAHDHNYKRYFGCLSSIEPPIIPLLAIYQSQVIFSGENAYVRRDGLINWKRCVILHKTLTQVLHYQQQLHSIPEDPMFLQQFQHWLKDCYAEEEMWEISQNLEYKRSSSGSAVRASKRRSGEVISKSAELACSITASGNSSARSNSASICNVDIAIPSISQSNPMPIKSTSRARPIEYPKEYFAVPTSRKRDIIKNIFWSSTKKKESEPELVSKDNRVSITSFDNKCTYNVRREQLTINNLAKLFRLRAGSIVLHNYDDRSQVELPEPDGTFLNIFPQENQYAISGTPFHAIFEEDLEDLSFVSVPGEDVMSESTDQSPFSSRRRASCSEAEVELRRRSSVEIENYVAQSSPSSSQALASSPTSAIVGEIAKEPKETTSISLSKQSPVISKSPTQLSRERSVSELPTPSTKSKSLIISSYRIKGKVV